MWQKRFEQYQAMGFTVVGIALDAEGIAPAKRYYERFGVTFPSLVDPNYATGFGAVPKTFFVDEHGVVQSVRGWEAQLKPASELQPITDTIRSQWTTPGERLEPARVAGLAERHAKDPRDLANTVELASRYLDLKLQADARRVLQNSLKHFDAKTVARGDDQQQARLLGQAYLQLCRATEGDRDAQVEYATLSFYLSPSIGFGKQIARVIAPGKFDGRPGGDFDNRFREATLRRLQRERQSWLNEK